MMKITYDLAMAAGADAANKNMREQGRITWNSDDYEIARATYFKLSQPDRRKSLRPEAKPTSSTP